MHPRYPIFIPSKGRHEYCMTMRQLELMNVEYRVIVEEQEYRAYSDAVGKKRVLVLPRSYQDNYDTCDDKGHELPVGSGAVRNYAWDLSIDEGFERHWVMDDNIRRFMRLNKNQHHVLRTGAGFAAMEDFVDRYENIAMAGPHYKWFIPQRTKHNPFSLNTRVYSCNLILNSVPFRWRGRYNEDTILSIDMLKAGWCTVQFKAFTQDKSQTQTMKGGNTDVLYAKGTTEKSQMLVREHPDVCRMTIKYGRVHHHADYSVFAANKLVRKKDVKIDAGPNEYGMKFRG